MSVFRRPAGRTGYFALGALLAASVAFGAAPATAATTSDSASVAHERGPAISRLAPQTIVVDDAAAITIVNRDEVVVDYKAPIVWPVAVSTPITDDFGPRISPTAGASSNHMGVDFDPGFGTPVGATAPGVVRAVVATDDGGCGVAVTIDHTVAGETFSSRYCHLAEGSLTVTQGQSVAAGQTIAAVGNTGVSTGAHLHFEIRLANDTPTDPIAWLHAHGV